MEGWEWVSTEGYWGEYGAWSDWSLYSEEIATFGEDHVYNQKDAEGFINLWGLPVSVQAKVKNANKSK